MCTCWASVGQACCDCRKLPGNIQNMIDSISLESQLHCSLIAMNLESNDHEGKGNNHDDGVGDLQLQFVPLALWGDDPVDEGS